MSAGGLATAPPRLALLRRGALLTPFGARPGPRGSTEISGAVHALPDGAWVPLASRASPAISGVRLAPAVLPQPLPEPAEILPGRSLYLGHLMHHYGHFLVETLSRAWMGSGAGFDRILLHPFVFRPGDAGPARWQRQLLRLAGLGNLPIRVVDRLLLAEDLTVPEQLWQEGGPGHAALPGLYRAMAERAEAAMAGSPQAVQAPRVYLTRKPRQGRVVNPDLAIPIFAERGFAILAPESLSAVQQLALYRRVEVLAGFTGSGLHNAVFMRPGTRVIELADGREARRAHVVALAAAAGRSSPEAGRLQTQLAAEAMGQVRGVQIPWHGPWLGAVFDPAALGPALDALLEA